MGVVVCEGVEVGITVTVGDGWFVLVAVAISKALLSGVAVAVGLVAEGGIPVSVLVGVEINAMGRVGYRPVVDFDRGSIATDTIKVESNVIGIRSKETPAYKHTALRLPHSDDATSEILHLALGKQGRAEAN